MGLFGRFVPALEPLAEVTQEAAGEGAVDEPVVVGEREVHDRANRDRVLAQLVLHDPRALDDRVRAENRRLRLADDRRPVEGSVTARVRDREGSALDVVRQELLLPRPLGDVGDRLRQSQQVERLRVLHHGHDEALAVRELEDRKSTRLNSSHVRISYAVFCLKKKKKTYSQFRLLIKKEKIKNI